MSIRETKLREGGDPMPMNDDQNEIQQLRREISRLQEQLRAQQPSDLAQTLITKTEFLADMARFAEGALSESDVRKRHYLSDEDWERLGSDDALVRAIQDEKTRRIRNGTHAREKAQKVFVKTPDVLDEILSDKSASPRHRIEASRELRATAAVGPEAQPPTEMFHITINLGDDYKLQVSQPIRPTPGNNELIDSTVLPLEDNSR